MMDALPEMPTSSARPRSFKERERARLVSLRDELFGDPGQGRYRGQPREFVLRDPARNLWAGIRKDALAHFARHRIGWHHGSDELPTGHLLSSQVACVNHLFALRQRVDLALAVLAGLDADVVAPERIGDGYVDFEYIGSRQHLAERGFARGSHCTSVDAVMAGRLADGSLRLFLIEWKYTEAYDGEDLFVPERSRVYDHLIAAPDSPFEAIEPRALYREPFYQLMRQTLLGCAFVRHGELGCGSFRHVHVVPDANQAFHLRVTAPELLGADVSSAWRTALRRPSDYLTRTPAEILRPAIDQADARGLATYLDSRYWAGDINDDAPAFGETDIATATIDGPI